MGHSCTVAPWGLFAHGHFICPQIGQSLAGPAEVCGQKLSLRALQDEPDLGAAMETPMLALPSRPLQASDTNSPLLRNPLDQGKAAHSTSLSFMLPIC